MLLTSLTGVIPHLKPIGSLVSPAQKNQHRNSIEETFAQDKRIQEFLCQDFLICKAKPFTRHTLSFSHAPLNMIDALLSISHVHLNIINASQRFDGDTLDTPLAPKDLVMNAP